MPKICERKLLLESLEIQVIHEYKNIDSEDNEDDDDLDIAVELLAYAQSNRYLGRGSHVPKVVAINAKLALLQALNGNRVRQEIRMDITSFNKLYWKIESHPVYEKYANCRRTDIRIQMMVALERLGCYGNGVSVGKLARATGTSGIYSNFDKRHFFLVFDNLFTLIEGSVVNFTIRFIIAVTDKLKSRLYWPDHEKREKIKTEIEQDYGFPSCIGFVDGTLIPLANTPSWSHQNFYSRKSFYAISSMIVCDNNKRITMLHSGYAGSAHDSRVYNGSPLANATSTHFSNDKYLLADSAYAPSLSIVPVFKKPFKC
jgi:hypothetical protein